MRRLACTIACLVGFLGLAAPAPAAPGTGDLAPVAVVERLHAALLDNMKHGKEIGFAERARRIDPVVREVFDLETMTRVSVGSGWQKLGEDDRKELVAAFARWTVATYAAQFKAWNGEQFVVTGSAELARSDVMVDTEIKPRSGKATALNYRLRMSAPPENGGRWRVIDILLDGAVSQLALRRADFAAVFVKGGAPALIAHLDALTGKLEASG